LSCRGKIGIYLAVIYVIVSPNCAVRYN